MTGVLCLAKEQNLFFFHMLNIDKQMKNLISEVFKITLAMSFLTSAFITQKKDKFISYFTDVYLAYL